MAALFNARQTAIAAEETVGINPFEAAIHLDISGKTHLRDERLETTQHRRGRLSVLTMRLYDLTDLDVDVLHNSIAAKFAGIDGTEAVLSHIHPPEEQQLGGGPWVEAALEWRVLYHSTTKTARRQMRALETSPAFDEHSLATLRRFGNLGSIKLRDIPTASAWQRRLRPRFALDDMLAEIAEAETPRAAHRVAHQLIARPLEGDWATKTCVHLGYEDLWETLAEMAEMTGVEGVTSDYRLAGMLRTLEASSLYEATEEERALVLRLLEAGQPITETRHQARGILED